MNNLYIKEKLKNPNNTLEQIIIYSLNVMGVLAAGNFTYFFYNIKSKGKLEVLRYIFSDDKLGNEGGLNIMVNLILSAMLAVLVTIWYITIKTIRHNDEVRGYNIKLMYVLGYKEKDIFLYEYKYICSDLIIAVITALVCEHILFAIVSDTEAAEKLIEQAGIGISNFYCDGMSVLMLILVVTVNVYVNVKKGLKNYLA